MAIGCRIRPGEFQEGLQSLFQEIMAPGAEPLFERGGWRPLSEKERSAIELDSLRQGTIVAAGDRALEKAHVCCHARVVQGEVGFRREHRAVRHNLAHQVDCLTKRRPLLLFVPFCAQQLRQYLSRDWRRCHREVSKQSTRSVWQRGRLAILANQPEATEKLQDEGHHPHPERRQGSI